MVFLVAYRTERYARCSLRWLCLILIFWLSAACVRRLCQPGSSGCST